MSFEDFLARQPPDDRNYEWVGGRVYAMTTGRERHALVPPILAQVLGPQARERGCRMMVSRLVRTTAAAYVPDLLVVCGPAAEELYEDDAALIVEVLSRSTAKVDRREKAAAYSQLPSLRAYVIIDPTRVRAEVGRPSRGSLEWTLVGPGRLVPTPFGDIDLGWLAAELDRMAST